MNLNKLFNLLPEMSQDHLYIQLQWQHFLSSYSISNTDNNCNLSCAKFGTLYMNDVRSSAAKCLFQCKYSIKLILK